MQATTLSQSEIVPETYPDAPSGLSTAAAALDPDFIWQRIESWVAYRWTPRAATWLVEGPGEWHAALMPTTISTTQRWHDDQWEDVDLPPSPFGGYVLPGSGLYMIEATVGGGDPAPVVPAAVNEAFRRLAEYWASAKPGRIGVSSERVTAGSITVARSQSPSWMANAMQNSGAGDLLRSYRKVA